MMVSESPDDTSFLVTWEDGPTGLLSNVIVGVPFAILELLDDRVE